MKLVTTKTYAGFFLTMLGKYTPLKVGKNYLEGIYNYRKYHDYLSTSGQPTEEQFQLIKEAGFTTVINLAPIDRNNAQKSAENCLKDEAGLLKSLGLNYFHMPVDFKYPEEDVYNDFVQLMAKLDGQKIWVHCAANMRVSAFLYRYRRDELKLEEQEARKVMDTIWKPSGQWVAFTKRRA